MKKIIENEAKMLVLANQFASSLTQTAIIFLRGPLGSGKTTFVRGFLRAKGITGPVKSPTYSLVETYALPGQKVHHFDLYRLQEAESLLELGIEDYLTADAICFIEWPERAEKELPLPDMIFDFQCIGEKRMVLGKAMTSLGKTLLQRLADE